MSNVEQFNRRSSRTADGALMAQYVLTENSPLMTPVAHHVLLALLLISDGGKAVCDEGWLVSRTGHGPAEIAAALDELARAGFLERIDAKTAGFAGIVRFRA